MFVTRLRSTLGVQARGYQVRRTFSSVVRAFAVLVAVFVVGLACQPTRTQPAPPPPQPAPPQQPAPAPPGPPAPGPPVLAVKIDNVPEARPAVGIGSADLVVVEPVEGGLSRLVAVFGGDRPPVVLSLIHISEPTRPY